MKAFFTFFFILVLAVGGIAGYAYFKYKPVLSQVAQNPLVEDVLNKAKDAAKNAATGANDPFMANLGNDPGSQDIAFAVGNSIGQIKNNLGKGIYTVQRDGKKIFYVTKGWTPSKDSIAGSVTDPVFSPDGQYILFNGHTLNGSYYVVPAKGGAVNQISPDIGFEPGGGWISPDQILLWSDRPAGGGVGLTMGAEKHFYVYSASKNTSRELTGLTTFEKKYTQRILTGNGYFITTGLDTNEHLHIVSHKADGSITGDHTYKWIGFQTVGEPAAASPTQLIWLIKKGGSGSIVAKDGFYLLDAATGALTLIVDETSYLNGIAATFGPTQQTIFPNPKDGTEYLYTTTVASQGGAKASMVKLIYRQPSGTIGRFTKDSASGGLSAEVGASWSPDGVTAAFTDSAALGLGSAIYTATPGSVPQLLVPYGNFPSWNPVR